MRLNYPVVLASGSPRRQDLLRTLVESFEIVVSDVDEDALTVDDPFVTAESLASAKARTVAMIRPDSLVIGGDTVVALPISGGTYRQFAKPKSAQDACEMLGALSGKTHLVITGISLVWPGGQTTFSDRTNVTFRSMTANEIAAYVATGIPMDKAGGYAIQDGADRFVVRVDGSQSNVIGLPMEKLERTLKALTRKDGQVS
ncbi:MAG: Maf family protein [Fimbriimonas sp.]|nr:Maf family protein [Fimbriimonas sp.]